MANHKTFQKPNLVAKTGGGIKPYISVHSDRQVLSISRRPREVMEAEPGDFVHLAIDRTGTPWIGIVDSPTEQGEPKIHKNGKGISINSTLMARHLVERLDEEPEGAVRFYFTGDTTEDPDTEATLHKLNVPT